MIPPLHLLIQQVTLYCHLKKGNMVRFWFMVAKQQTHWNKGKNACNILESVEVTRLILVGDEAG